MRKVINAVTEEVLTDWYCEQCGKEVVNINLFETFAEENGRPYCACNNENMILSLIHTDGEVHYEMDKS